MENLPKWLELQQDINELYRKKFEKLEHYIKCLEDRVEELEDNKAEKDGLGELFESMNPNNK